MNDPPTSNPPGDCSMPHFFLFSRPISLISLACFGFYTIALSCFASFMRVLWFELLVNLRRRL